LRQNLAKMSVGIRTAVFLRRKFAHKKVKGPRYRSGVVQRVGRGIALLFHDRNIRRV
jgi:hypothetical protein